MLCLFCKCVGNLEERINILDKLRFNFKFLKFISFPIFCNNQTIWYSITQVCRRPIINQSSIINLAYLKINQKLTHTSTLYIYISILQSCRSRFAATPLSQLNCVDCARTNSGWDVTKSFETRCVTLYVSCPRLPVYAFSVIAAAMDVRYCVGCGMGYRAWDFR